MKKTNLLLFIALVAIIMLAQFKAGSNLKNNEFKILYLHHSTGNVIFNGQEDAESGKKVDIPTWFEEYNLKNDVEYSIKEQIFPKAKPYGWKNYPYDYYNIWVKNAGSQLFMEEQTLEILTEQYDMISFKHCFPVSNVLEESGTSDINSEVKTLGNYQLQYEALKQKLHQFPETKFLVWTGAALNELNTTAENAARAKVFFDWVKNEWDESNDNIFIWDFFELETEGGLYLKPAYAVSPDNSHPNKEFASSVPSLFGQRVVDVIENNGVNTTCTGIEK